MNESFINSYILLSKIFSNHGYRLYMVGGTVRDYLLHKEILDFDLCSDATPSEMISFLTDYDDSFKKYGYIKCHYNNLTFDITTLRKEGKYKDYRHPSYIEYVKDIKLDYVRRDFTINALYMDDYFKIYDYCNGQEDLKNKVVRFVGKAKKRIKEDPLRILRAIRFSITYNFKIDEKTKKAIRKYGYLLTKLNKEKVKLEIKKFRFVNNVTLKKIFDDFAIHQYIDVIE